MIEKQIKEITVVFEDDCPVILPLEHVKMIDIVCDKEAYTLYCYEGINEYWKDKFRLLKKASSFRIVLNNNDWCNTVFNNPSIYNMINSLQVVYVDGDEDTFLMPCFAINDWNNVNQEIFTHKHDITIKINDKRTIKKYFKYCWSYICHVAKYKTFYPYI